MTSAWQAVDWLNWDNRSFLSPGNNHLVKSFRDQATQDHEKITNLDRLVNLRLSGPARAMEWSEILVNCGAFCQSLGRSQEARKHLDEAVHIYEAQQDELHRQAMAEWVRYWVVFQGGNENESYLAAERALNHILQREKVFGRAKDVTRERWYHEAYLNMYSDLVLVHRYLYDWLFKFNGSHLVGAAFVIKEKADKEAKGKNYSEACRNLELLKNTTRRTSDRMETGEALAFCGLINYEMGNLNAAVDLLRQAQANYTPYSHEHVLVRWMMALIKLNIPDKLCEAIEQMECCIEHTARLAQTADYADLPGACSWYKTLQEAMRRAMKTLVIQAI